MTCGFIRIQIRNKWNKMITSCTCTALYLLQRTFTASSLMSFFYTSGQPDDHINPPGSNTTLKLVNIISLVLISSLNSKLIYHLLYISTWMSPKHKTEPVYFFSPRIYSSPTTNHWCTSQIIGHMSLILNFTIYHMQILSTLIPKHSLNSSTSLHTAVHISTWLLEHLIHPLCFYYLFLFTQIAECM